MLKILGLNLTVLKIPIWAKRQLVERTSLSQSIGRRHFALPLQQTAWRRRWRRRRGWGLQWGALPLPPTEHCGRRKGRGGGKQRWPMGGPDAAQTRGVGDVTTSIGAELVRDNSYRSVQCILLIRPSILYDENCSYKQDGLIPYHSIITILGISCDHLRSGR